MGWLPSRRVLLYPLHLSGGISENSFSVNLSFLSGAENPGKYRPGKLAPMPPRPLFSNALDRRKVENAQ
jgi:hypothetical protein